MMVSDLEALWQSTNRQMEDSGIQDYGLLLELLDRIEYEIADRACPWGRARQRKYGVKPNEPLPLGKE